MEKSQLCCKGNHSPSRVVPSERTTNARSGVNGLTIQEIQQKIDGWPIEYKQDAEALIADIQYDLTWWPHLRRKILVDFYKAFAALEEELAEEQHE